MDDSNVPPTAVGPVWVGLDLGEEQSSIAVVDEHGHSIHEQSCGSSVADVEAALSEFAIPRIALIGVEAGTATHLVRKLRACGYPIAIFEARKASRFLAIRRSKTDASDARGLADLARLGTNTVSQVHLKSLEFQHLRSDLVLRHKLIQVRVTVEGGIRSRLRLYGRRLKSTVKPGGLRINVEAELSSLLAEEGLDIGAQVRPLVELCESLRSYLRDFDRTLQERAREHPVCARFMEIPGVGPICSLSFYSAVEDPNRFRRSADVGAYLGLVPRRRQSGDMSRSMGITKTGNKLTRYHLTAGALALRRAKTDCALRDWDAALKERIGAGRARVALARKLAVLMLLLWKSGTEFEPYPNGAPADAPAEPDGRPAELEESV
jgi:transposase